MSKLNSAVPLVAACVACAWALPSGAAFAQEKYPSRPIRLVIPFAPGGGSDVTARLLGPRIAERMGQPLVIDNRPAASGVVGADIVAKAVPDGYTLLGTTVTFVINGTLQKGLPYDAFKDFTPITQAIVSPFGLLLHPSVPAKTVKELIAYARANPGKLLYGSSGPGSSPHLSAELFLSMAGLKMTHVPYKGIAPAITAQLGNEVQLTFSNVFSTLGHWKSGRLRLVAHGGSKRAESFPDIPTMAESGLPGYESSNWYGYVTTARTPRAIIQTLNQAFVAAVNQPEVRKILVAQGNDVIANTPEEFAKVIQADAERWGGIGRKLGISLD
ncbi:MAG: Bug family tripartite tricarboxylate transporter substrate binding protein [Burkholderiales bacterium]